MDGGQEFYGDEMGGEGNNDQGGMQISNALAG